jgi:hypothetical protein
VREALSRLDDPGRPQVPLCIALAGASLCGALIAWIGARSGTQAIEHAYLTSTAVLWYIAAFTFAAEGIALLTSIFGLASRAHRRQALRIAAMFVFVSAVGLIAMLVAFGVLDVTLSANHGE